mgnify:CR=1 FL=1
MAIHALAATLCLTLHVPAPLVVKPYVVQAANRPTAAARFAVADNNAFGVFPTTTILSGEVFTGDLSDMLDDVAVDKGNCGGKGCVSDEQRVAELKVRQQREEEAARRKYEEVVKMEQYVGDREAGKLAATEALESARAARAAEAKASLEMRSKAVDAMGVKGEAVKAPRPDRSDDKALCFWCG